jgi:hypothetical protein
LPNTNAENKISGFKEIHYNKIQTSLEIIAMKMVRAPLNCLSPHSESLKYYGNHLKHYYFTHNQDEFYKILWIVMKDIVNFQEDRRSL